MLRSTLVLSILVGAVGNANADSVVIGRGISNGFVALPACPPDRICMNSLYVWEFRARRTVVGERVVGRVRAVAAQHVDATPEFVQSVELFVVRPIDDPAIREEFGVELYLVALSPAYEDSTYCLPESPATYGLDIADNEVSIDPDSDYYCFPISLVR